MMNEAIDLIDQNLPTLFMKLIEKAHDGDREALIYLIDRRMGKPRQDTGLEISGGDDIGGGLLAQLFTIMQVKRKELETPKVLQISSNALAEKDIECKDMVSESYEDI